VAAVLPGAVADVLTRKAVRPAAARRQRRISAGALAATPGFRLVARKRMRRGRHQAARCRAGLVTSVYRQTRAMVAALGARFVSARMERPARILPADSSLPLTEVVVR